ncbi:MAG: hypothetical protein CFE21_19540 [Bacteroidetes bacterium B1(2017)]|nr:MAG: hypothetical protein CFE21_19540 [Bacteroidetes bacterium B1(2017)]
MKALICELERNPSLILEDDSKREKDLKRALKNDESKVSGNFIVWEWYRFAITRNWEFRSRKLSTTSG